MAAECLGPLVLHCRQAEHVGHFGAWRMTSLGHWFGVTGRLASDVDRSALDSFSLCTAGGEQLLSFFHCSELLQPLGPSSCKKGTV